MNPWLKLFLEVTGGVWVLQVYYAMVKLFGLKRTTKVKFILILVPGYFYCSAVYYTGLGMKYLVERFKKLPLTSSREKEILTPEEEVKEAINLKFEDLPKMINRNESIFLTVVKWRLEKGI